jgi:hypothetical protein
MVKILLICLLIGSSVQAQHLTKEADSEFLHYFVYTYLPSIQPVLHDESYRVTRINDKLNWQIGIIPRFSAGDKKDLSNYLHHHLVNSKDSASFVEEFIRDQYWSARDYLPDSVLANTDSIAYYDSSAAFHRKKLATMPVPEAYSRPYQLGLYKMLPDTLRDLALYHQAQIALCERKYLAASSGTVYITKPLFLFGGDKCFVSIMFYRFGRRMVVVFQKKEQRWAVDQVLYDNSSIGSDE